MTQDQAEDPVKCPYCPWIGKNDTVHYCSDAKTLIEIGTGHPDWMCSEGMECEECFPVKATFKISCSIANDGSHFGCTLRAPHHGIGPKGIEGQTEEEFEKNLAFSDKVMAAIYQGFHNAPVSLPDGGLCVDFEIGPGEVDFQEIETQTQQAISEYLEKK